ncbi:MAG: hypothetical protein HZC51_01045 [Nitrospirae bacterium]|nr:hypothetical protein [Nitrospirota bacterium]
MWTSALLVLPLVLAVSFCPPAYAEDIETRLNALEATLNAQQRTINEQQRLIGELKEELAAVKAAPATAEAPPVQAATAEVAAGLFGGSALTNPYISVILDANLFTSSVKEGSLSGRGIPGYTSLGIDRRKGFNLSAAEVFLYAPVDPYFNLYVQIPVTEAGVELEEAYFVTSSLPAGLQVKGGKFKSGFGRVNGQHPHAWDFADVPLIYRAFLGDEGITEKGAQVTYLPSLPVYLQLGAEALQGENGLLFGADAKSGPHAFAAFAKASVDTSDFGTVLFGPSVLFGSARNGSLLAGSAFDGDSRLFCFESLYKWKPSRQRGLTVQCEYFYGHQKGGLTDDVLLTSAPLERIQDGFYLQALYQLGRWRAGARYDRLDLFAHSLTLGSEKEGFGPAPWRATGAVEFNPTEFSRLRFQYNHDMSGRDGRANDEWFLQVIFGIGAHAAHAF